MAPLTKHHPCGFELEEFTFSWVWRSKVQNPGHRAEIKVSAGSHSQRSLWGRTVGFFHTSSSFWWPLHSSVCLCGHIPATLCHASLCLSPIGTPVVTSRAHPIIQDCLPSQDASCKHLQRPFFYPRDHSFTGSRGHYFIKHRERRTGMEAPILCRTVREGGSKSEPCDDSEREHSRPREQDWTQPPGSHRRSPRLRDGGRGEGADLVGPWL